MKDKKKKRLPIIILLGLLLVCAVLSGLLIGGVIKIPTVGGQKVDLQTASLIKKADQVSDEMTLRELLLLDLELEITVTDDIVTDEPFLVRGTKTLRGDATITIDAPGKFEELYVLEVQKRSRLTMDGLTLAGKGMGGAIQVNQRAQLIYESGNIKNVYQGISTNGEVTINDVHMSNISKNGIYSSFKSQVYLNGGTYTKAGNNLVEVTTGGDVEVNGGSYTLANGAAFKNAGVLVIHDATISEITGNAISNSGELTTKYKGDKEEGYIEISNITATAISINSYEDVKISDVHVAKSGSNNLYVGSIVAGCTVLVDHCLFEQSKGNAISAVGDVNITNSTVLNAGSDAFYIREGAKVKLENIVIESPKGRGIRVLGSTLTAEKVEIRNAGTIGISVNPTKSLPGKATLSEIHMVGTKTNNLYMNDETEVYIKDSVLEKAKRTNVAVTDGTLTMENVQVLGNLDEKLYAVSVGPNATVNMKGNSVITGATLRGVQVGNKATFNMLGGSIRNIKSTSSAAGVYVTRYATFNMKGGSIYGNYAKAGAGAVTVQGVMNMSGGTIRDNESGSYGGAINIGYDNSKGGTKGVFNMTGGTIKNNIAKTSGGAIHVSNGTIANLYGGTITGNVANGNYNSSGILNNGEVTMKGNFFMGEDKIYFNRTNVVLKIKGNTLKKHSAKTPLLVVPCESTNVGTTVVKCDNNAAVVSLLNNYVTSGVRAFTLQEKGDAITVSHNAPDMDMTDADTVHVKTFAELKEAIRSTRTKRNIVICADIEMSSAITVMSGTTVAIRDDGEQRVLKRKDGNSSAFFTVYYGTGIILKSTTAGNLVVNGEHSEKVKEKDLSTLITAYGTTVFEDVAFENNEIHGKSSQAGAFLYQRAGSFTAIGSSFTNGYTAKSGGAMYLAKGDCYIKDCIFEGNEAGENAGAISTWEKGNVPLTIENTIFKNNKATKAAGAINQIAGKLTVTDCTFENNQSKSTGGSIVLNKKSEAVIKGTDEAKAVFKNNTGSSGGAIYLYQAQLSVDGYTFEGNTAKNNGGAIYQDKGASNVTATNTTFKGNTANQSGGAICIKGNLLNLENCLFEENVTKKQGGAIYQLEGNPKVTASNTTFKSNIANGHGGAMYLAKGEDFIKDCIYEGNQADKDGGAICTEEKGKVPLTIENTTFKNNKANTGGALRQSAGKLTVTDCTFENNQSKSTGGSIVLNKKSEAVIKGTDEAKAVFKNNTGSSGGAIYLYQAQLSVDGYTFEGNTAKNNGGAIYQDKGTSDVTATNTTFKGNTANKSGGAIYITGNLLNVENCLFEENVTKESGGAIYQGEATSNVTASNTTFKSNIAKNNGGAIYSLRDLTVDGATFTNNAAKYGGAIFAKKDKETDPDVDIYIYIQNATFERNATTSGGYGGALHLVDISDAKVSASDFNSNTCDYSSDSNDLGGGAIYLQTSSLALENSSLENNTAKEDGGAIHCRGSVLTATGCTFKNNSSENGNGAIYNKTKTVALTDCTFTNDIVVNKSNGVTTVSGNTTGATFVYTQKAASVVIGSAGITSDITITPSDYSTDYVVVGGVNETVKDKIKVTPDEKGTEYTIKENGRLRAVGTVPVAAIGETLYDTLSEALEVAKEVPNTTTDNPVVITVLHDTTLSSTQSITYHVKLITASDSNVTIRRDKNVTLFDVAEGGSLYIDGNITLDGNKDVVTGTTNFITNAGTFTLGKAAVIKSIVGTNNRAIYSTAGTVNLYGTLSGNETGTGVKAAAIRIKDGILNVDGATFENNIGGYGAAIYVDAGTLNVDAGTFTGNSGKYGGAIFLCAGVDATIQNSLFSENNSTDASTGGGAIYSESTEFILKACTFADNTANSTGTAVYNNGGTVDVSDCTFTDETFANAKANGKAVVSGALTGVNFVYKVKNASVVIGDAGITSDITITPKSYETDYSVVGGAVADAKSKIKVTPNGGVEYSITDDGKLKVVVENKAAKIGDTSYDTLSGALAAAKLVENTTVDNPVVITVLQDAELTATETITNHVKLTTLADSEVTITRGEDVVMFQIADADNKGVGSLNIDGKITLDGNEDIVATKNLILHYGEALTLGTNATIQNAISNQSAVYSYNGTVTLQGMFKDNENTSGKGGALRVGAGTLNIEGASFTGNYGKYGGAIYANNNVTINVNETEFVNNASLYGAALIIEGSVNVNIQNTKFEKNSTTNSSHGGAIYLAESVQLALDNCEFANNKTAADATAVNNNGGTVNVSDCTFVNETFANKKKTGKTTISGTLTGVTFVYKYNAANVVLGEGGLRAGSDVTMQLHSSCEVGDAVLSKGTNATDAELARAAEIVKIEQTNATVETWKYIAADGKLAQGIEDGAVTVTTVDELKTAIANATTIYVMNDISISEAIEISKNITLKSIKAVTLTRGANKTMFKVTSTGSLTISGAITVDGANLSATTVLINNLGSFTLGAGATVKNAKTSGTERIVYSNSKSTITNIYGVFKDNTSAKEGVIRAKGTLNVDGALFKNNKSTRGGAIYLDSGSTANISNALFAGNGKTGASGGAIYSEGTLNLTSSTFKDNVGSEGGAVHCQNATLTVTNCTFTGNEAAGSAGGAIRFIAKSTATKYANITVSGGTFENNTAKTSGGAISVNRTNITVNNGCSFVNNAATEKGGAIHIDVSHINNVIVAITFDGLSFMNNTAASGGAIYNGSNGSMNTETCTFGETDTTYPATPAPVSFLKRIFTTFVDALL